VSGGGVGTPYSLPFSPTTVAFGQSPTLVLGENGIAFATDAVDSVNGPAVASFNISSGSTNWKYQAGPQSTLSILGVLSDGSLAINDSQNGTLEIGTNGPPATTVAPSLGSIPQPSWGGPWYAPGASGYSEISLPLQFDDASPWASPGGNPSQNGLSNASCGCLAQSVVSGDAVVSEENRQGNDPAKPPYTGPVPPNCPICALQSPQCVTQGTGPAYLILVGDEGLNNPNGHNYDVNYGFALVAQQKANDLQGQGNQVIACRVSTVQQFSNAITGGELESIQLPLTYESTPPVRTLRFCASRRLSPPC
jgi:hypothetical protein